MPNNLEAWLKYIDTISLNQVELGLERITQVAGKLNLLQTDSFVVTVAGTNGKGSTCAYLGSILQACDLTVGIYSSPHLFKFNERITINGMWADDEELCEAFEIIEEARAELNIPLTYFEFGTLAALWLFSSTKLDVIILEVGLGGRLDAVNMMDADLAIITSIGLDHMQYLGNTTAQIAEEKLGVVRPNIPVIYADNNPPQIILNALANNKDFYLANRDYQFTTHNDQQKYHAGTFDYASEKYEFNNLPNPGFANNAAGAVCAASIIYSAITEKQIAQGLIDAYVPGRFELHNLRIKGKLLNIVFDVAHNPPAVSFLSDNLVKRQLISADNKLYAVFSVLDDKDLQGMLQVMPKISNFAIVELDCERGQKIDEINNNLQQINANISQHTNIAEALNYQINQANDGDVIVVFGSFYVVSEAKKAFSKLSLR